MYVEKLPASKADEKCVMLSMLHLSLWSGTGIGSS
jgi:hypothetical protein